MTGLAKGLIATAIVLVIIIIAGVAAAVYVVVRQSGPLLAKSKESLEEGQHFGPGTDNEGCLSATLKRYKKDPGFFSAVSDQLFLRGCLATSHPTDGFCDTVPGPLEFVKTAKWQIERCQRAGMANDSYCPQLLAPVQQFCETRRTGAAK